MIEYKTLLFSSDINTYKFLESLHTLALPLTRTWCLVNSFSVSRNMVMGSTGAALLWARWTTVLRKVWTTASGREMGEGGWKITLQLKQADMHCTVVPAF